MREMTDELLAEAEAEIGRMLLEAAEAAARSIEAKAAERGTPCFSGQTFYGVEVEALVGGRWVRARDLEDGATVGAVRLFDCDGNRGTRCESVKEVEAQRDWWVEILWGAGPEVIPEVGE